MKFSIELPVQFRDIDVMGHVNNATYLQYMETARVELARSLGQVREGFRASFIVASVRCEFKKPIRDERRISVWVWVSRIGDRSWNLDYSIRGPKRVEYAVDRTTQVAYDYKTRSAVQISGKLRRKLAKHVEAPLKFRETALSAESIAYEKLGPRFGYGQQQVWYITMVMLAGCWKLPPVEIGG